MWNYVELTVGIVAGSLPALKPLFIRVLNAAREKTTVGSGKLSAQDGPGTLGHHKQDQPKFTIALSRYESGKRTSSTAMDLSVWHKRSENNSQESVLPLNMPKSMKNSIVVTKEFHIGRD